MDEEMDRQPRERREEEQNGLSPREQATMGQLRLMDPQLAGLYEHGIRLLREIRQSGNVYLLAHCGRELSRGVLQLLLDDEGLEASAQELQQEHRPRIAQALYLPDNDLRVNEWFRLHRLFCNSVHWRYPGLSGADADAVRDAFERLSSLLYGRVAPYFATERELDSLLEIELPTAEYARRLRDLQLRFGQRTYFFGRLTNPAWVEYLDDAGFFSNPPVRQVNPDQSWHARAWPEGNYLVKAAAGAPAAVSAVLEAVPPLNDNPAVWNIVAKAARCLPSDLAVSMVPRLTRALKTVPAQFFSESVADLVVVLAEEKRDQAFELADHLLYVADCHEVDEEAKEGLQFLESTDWVFPRFGHHSHDKQITRIVAALETLAPKQTLWLLLTKIQRVERLADDLDLGRSWHFMRLETEGQPDRDDVVAMLVEGAIEVANRLAAKGPVEAEWVMGTIDSQNGNFFSRICYLVLAQVGNHLQGRLDQVLQSEEARSPGFSAADLAALLRAQFRNASDGARSDYVEAVKAGSQQRRILTFFRGDIPEEFHDLATELGVPSVEPPYRERQLAEVGVYSEGSYWRGDESPVSAVQLSTWSPEEVVSFLRGWRSSERIESVFGLQRSLATYAKENAPAALSVLNCVVEEGVDPSAVEGILDGLGKAAEAGSDLDWGEALAGVREVMQLVTTLDLDRTESIGQWRSAAGRATRLIEEGCRKDSIPFELASEVWALFDKATTVPTIWQVKGRQDRSLEAVIEATLNDASGNVANAVMSGALWDYRSRTRRSDNLEEDWVQARHWVQQPLLPILDRWLEDEGPNAAVPRAVMGGYLPQLHLLAPEWVEAHAPNLFQGGLEDPVRRPTWTTYMSRALPHGTVFDALRPWYLRAAKEAAVWVAAVGDVVGARNPTQKLAFHLVIAYLLELVSVGDEDRLLETAYENLSSTDWGHAYWAVSRGSVPESSLQRLVDLWEWRILELEKDEGSDRTMEQAKALGWLLWTPEIPAVDLIRLGQATARLARGHIEMYSNWERMLVLAQIDPDGAFRIVKAVLRTQLLADFPYVAVEEVRPFLAHVLRAGNPETQDQARSLVNELGEFGFRELKDLLQA